MKLFIPAVGYRIKLTSPWTFKLYNESRNDSLYVLINPEFKKDYEHWGDRYDGRKLKHVMATMPAATVLEVDRVYVRTANKTAQSKDDDYDSMTFKVVDHPALTKRVRFWAKLSDVNNIEYELPPDHTVAKEKAIANAKKPKKLTPDSVRDQVKNAIFYLDARRSKKTAPVWLTKGLIKQFESLAAEHRRLHEPWDRAIYADEQRKHRSDLENQLKAGTLSLPIGLADKVKTIDDLIAQGYYEHYFAPYEKRHREHISEWKHMVPYTMLGGYGRTSQIWHRLPDGTKCRTYTMADHYQHYVHHHPNLPPPKFDHLWVKVYSNVDDTEITKVEAGFAADPNVVTK